MKIRQEAEIVTMGGTRLKIQELEEPRFRLVATDEDGQEIGPVLLLTQIQLASMAAMLQGVFEQRERWPVVEV